MSAVELAKMLLTRSKTLILKRIFLYFHDVGFASASVSLNEIKKEEIKHQSNSKPERVIDFKSNHL